MKNTDKYEYYWGSSKHQHSNSYLATPVLDIIESHCVGKRVLDVGCGNGTFTRLCSQQGYDMVGIDNSPTGIERALENNPDLDMRSMSVYDDLAGNLGEESFDAVILREVIEHLSSPRICLSNIRAVLKRDGLLVLTTPYHGYLKNLAMALSGSLEKHFQADWETGHIKFFSERTIRAVLEDVGYRVLSIGGAGRCRYFWKSMVVSAMKDELKTDA